MTSLTHAIVTLSIITLILSISLVHHYAMPGTSIFIKALAILAFCMGFGGIALLPLDLSLTVSTGSNDLTAEPNATYLPWKITYWSTFLLAWTLLPFTRETLMSGHFACTSRMRNSFRKSLRNYVIMITITTIAIVSLAIHYHTWEVIPILMALGNTYGLLLVSLLLGYGLVDLPRKMWRRAKPGRELRRLQIMASTADDALFDAVWVLQDCEDAIDAAIDTVESNDDLIESEHSWTDPCSKMTLKQCVDELVKQKNLTATLGAELESRRTRHHSNGNGVCADHDAWDDEGSLGSTNSNAGDDIPTVDYLAKLNGRIKIAQARLSSAEQRWTELVEKSKYYSSLVNIVPPSLSQTPPSSCLARIKAEINYFWVTKLSSTLFRLFAIIMATLSVMVLWSEATMSLSINLSPFAFILSRYTDFDGESQGLNVVFQIFALIPLLYMSACVYSSLFKIGFFGVYCLRGYKQSPGVALLFNAQYLIRMQFSLGYNYLLMLKYDTSATNCAFSRVMSNMATVPFLGTSFSVYAPLIILALCSFTICDGYPRLLGLLGVEHEDVMLMSDSETLDSQVNEGIVLLNKYTRKSSQIDDNAETTM